MSSFLQTIANSIQDNVILAPILVFLAGILTSFMPCCLTSIPLVIGYVSLSEDKSTKTSFIYSLIFVVGEAVTFVIMGIVASFFGSLLGNYSKIWYYFLGTIMLLMSLQTMEIYNIIPSTNLISKNNKKGIIGAFLAGVLAGLFSSPCSTPVLIGLLAMIGQKGSMVYGIILMLIYSLGHGILTIIFGSSVGLTSRIKKNKNYGKYLNIIRNFLGILMMLIGFYLFWSAF